MAEAMWAGKPVIATGYSGNLDFMNGDNSYLVDHRLVPIGPGNDPYPGSGVWADPDVEHAARLMREVFSDREAARRRGERAAADIRASHSPEAAGTVHGAAPGAHSHVCRNGTRSRRTGPLYTEWVSELIRSGPVPPAAKPRFGSGRRAVRKGLLRLLKPLAVHERMVDSELLKAIEKLDANLQSLAAAHGAALRQIDEMERRSKNCGPAARRRRRSGGRAAQRPLVGQLLVLGGTRGRAEPQHCALGSALWPGAEPFGDEASRAAPVLERGHGRGEPVRRIVGRARRGDRTGSLARCAGAAAADASQTAVSSEASRPVTARTLSSASSGWRRW